MADRRMVTKKIIESDAFLDMPLTSQALYLHLIMNADDDGFVNSPKKVVRYVGSSDDDLKILLGKGFLILFESGIVVVKHWKMHNYIPKDRYKPTDYIEEKRLLKLKENGSYTLGQDGTELDKEPLYTDCIQNGYIGKDRLGKDRLIYSTKKSKFKNFEERNYDTNELEKEIIENL